MLSKNETPTTIPGATAPGKRAHHGRAAPTADMGLAMRAQSLLSWLVMMFAPPNARPF
jgi:hypothetical protein